MPAAGLALEIEVIYTVAVAMESLVDKAC